MPPKNIDILIAMNDLQQLAQPVSTAVTQPFLPDKGNLPSSEDFQKNQALNLANIVGSIGTPQGLSEEELLDIVMSVSPVGASVRGGKVAKSTLQQLSKLAKDLGIKVPKSIIASDLRGKGLEKTIENITGENIYSKARIQNLKALNKYGIADPDKQGMVDPISALLNYFSKN